MKRLLLLRHAKAVPGGTGPDHGRELAPRGLSAAEAAGRTIADRGIAVGRTLVSDAARTRQTAEIALAQLAAAPPLRLEPRLYEAGVDAILALVSATDPGVDTLLVVGHNPGLGECARRLARRGPAQEMERLLAGFPTAALAVIALAGDSWSAASAGGTLEQLWLPE